MTTIKQRVLPAMCARWGDRRSIIGLVLVLIGPIVCLSACQSPLDAQGPDDSMPRSVSFPTSDGGLIHGLLYGSGAHGVVLAHGGRFNKESWAEQAPVLADAGLRVLSIDMRGYGESIGGSQSNDQWEGFALDVLGAIRFLRESGAARVSLVGGSMGGWAAARASVLAEPGEIDRLVLLAHATIEQPERMQGRKLFVVSEGDAMGSGRLRLPMIRDQYERAPGPKELLVVGGSAHAQYMFETPEGDQLLEKIVEFLTER